MTYQLGIDFGTTTVAAAIHRPGAPAEIVLLGGTVATVPAVLHLARDGRVTVGEGASRRAGIDPGRVVRVLKRRVGDPTPIVVGRESWTAEELTARVVRWVVDRVAEQEA
jgi:molecular chaperone DnaK